MQTVASLAAGAHEAQEHAHYTTTGLDEPCAVCGEPQGTHVFATADGRGHDWVPVADNPW